MLPSEKRHGPPGVNSRNLVSNDDDFEVLKSIEDKYFSDPAEFDATKHILESAPEYLTEEWIDEVFNKLKRQHQVISNKALHLISQHKEDCDREFNEIQKIGVIVGDTLKTCRQTRSSLNSAKNDMAVSTFFIIANYRKRLAIKSVLKSIELLRDLRSIDSKVADLINSKEYHLAISEVQISLKNAQEHKELTCISDIIVKLQDLLVWTEEKLDVALSEICYKFDENAFDKLRRAYKLLGKFQASIEQLHMHYASAINIKSLSTLNAYIEGSCDFKFQEMCRLVPVSKTPDCLLDLCENLFFIMKSYYRLVEWYFKNDVVESSDKLSDIESNINKEYIRQKLKAGLQRIWKGVQSKVSTFLSNCCLEETAFEKFVQILGMLRKLTQLAEAFCGDRSDLLQEFIKDHSLEYIKKYHSSRLEELKLFLENEAWTSCPVKNDFSILNLPEYKQFKRHINPNLNKTVSQSDAASSATSQEDSVRIVRYFEVESNRTPFEIFRDHTVTNADIFGVDIDSETSDTDDECELDRDYVDEDVVHANKTDKNSIIVANTTLLVLKNCGQYLQICRYLPQISLEIILLMNQIFDYYLYTVHLFFTADLTVSTTTLYSNKLNATLKRITNFISNSELNLNLNNPILESNEHSLHNLSERIVGVESLVFLGKQFELIQPYLHTLIAQHKKIILEHFTDYTLSSTTDLRLPVYMASISKAIDYKTTLTAMSQVKWSLKTITPEHSPYIDMILRMIQIFALRLEEITSNISVENEVLISIWGVVSKFLVHLLVEGYSNATKCTNAGRGLMQIDYRQLFVKLEKISGVKPLPYQEYVDTYIKAYYLPRTELEVFLKTRIEYSNKHLNALINCMCENKKDRLDLISILESREI